MSASLRFDAVTVGYGATSVLSDVSLEVGPGEVVGLVGPNGAGKSTLLRAITADAQLLTGEIKISGRSVARMPIRERAAVVGVVPQQVSASFSFPADEFVQMGRHPHLPRFGQMAPTDIEAVQEAMQLTDTAHLAHKPVDALSGGDLQRLVYAQALAARPQVLLLDEPVSQLDLNHRLQMLDLTRALADAGMAVLVVFHDLDLAARYSDRIAVVADASVSPAGAPSSVITTAMLRSVFGVRAVVGVDQVTGTVSVTPVLRDGAVLAANRGRVHVVGGSGVAAPLMRRLVLSGWTVTAGALNTGDADATVADALGIDYPPLPPFAPMDAQSAVQAAQLAAQADAIVVCEVPFGHGNIDNLLVAVRSGRSVILMGSIDGRDYAGGAAESYWAEAIDSGAVVVGSFDEVEHGLSSLS